MNNPGRYLALTPPITAQPRPRDRVLHAAAGPEAVPMDHAARFPIHAKRLDYLVDRGALPPLQRAVLIRLPRRDPARRQQWFAGLCRGPRGSHDQQLHRGRVVAGSSDSRSGRRRRCAGQVLVFKHVGRPERVLQVSASLSTSPLRSLPSESAEPGAPRARGVQRCRSRR
jgi:hypothetical protein